MAGASTVKVTFLGDAQSLAKAAQMAQGQIDKMSSSVKKSTAVGSFFGSMAGGLASNALGQVQAFAQGSVDAFAAVEDATGAAGVQFGDAADDVVAFAERAASTLGLSKRAALDAQNTFGTLGKAAGLTDAPLAHFSRQMTGLAGDLASFKGTSTEQAINAVGAALRGETEPIRAYGVLLDQASIEAEALAMGLAKPAKNMEEISAAQSRAMLAQKAYNEAVKEHGPSSDQATRAELALGTATRALTKATEGKVPPLSQANKVLASQSLILKQTKDAQGDFARTSDSTANTQKRLAAESENAQAKLGEKLAPAMTFAREAAIKLVDGVTLVANGIGAAGQMVDSNRTTFMAIAGVITAVVLPALITMGVRWTVTAAQATASAARQSAAWLMTQASAYKSVVAHAAAFAAVIAGWVRAGAQAMAQAARMAAAWLIAMGPIAIVIAAVVGAVVLIIKNWDKIKAATAKAWEAVKNAVKKAIDAVVFVLANFTGPGLIIKHFDKIKKGVSDAVGKVVDFMTALPGRIVSAVGNLGTLLSSAGWDVIEGFVDGLKNGANNLIQAAIDWALDKIPGWAKKVLHINSPSKRMIPIGEGVSEGVAVGIKNGTDQVEKAAKKLADKAAAAVERMRDKLSAVRDFANDIRAGFRDLGDITGIDTMVEDAEGNRTEGGFAAMLAGLQKRAADAGQFVAAMQRLKQAGLNTTTLDQLREGGPENLTAAQNLLAGGMGGIGEVNRLVSQINAAGAGFAATEAKSRFGIGPNASLDAREARVILDVRGGEDDLKRLLRKWVRAEGGNVQKVLGK